MSIMMIGTEPRGDDKKYCQRSGRAYKTPVMRNPKSGSNPDKQDMKDCQHNHVRFDNGRLICTECKVDKTPPAGYCPVLVFDNYRLNKYRALEKIADAIPDSELEEIVLFAEFLKARNKG